MLKHTVLYLSIAMLASGVVPAAEDARPIPWRLEPVKTIKGCKVPECVVVDSENALAYISNVEALPDEYWSDDGRGFISLMTVDGKMLKRRWLNSEPGALIHGPKGMCLLKDVLYIADNSRLLARPLQPGGQLEVLSVPGAQRINDLATEGTHVFASDTTRGVIYKVNPVSGEVAVLKSPPSVNGITFHKGAFFAVSWDLHDIFEIDLSGETRFRLVSGRISPISTALRCWTMGPSSSPTSMGTRFGPWALIAKPLPHWRTLRRPPTSAWIENGCFSTSRCS